MTATGAKAVAWRIALGFITSVVVLVACGTFVVHVLAHSGFGHWEMSAPRSLVADRTPTLNTATGAASRSGDTQGAIAIALVVSVLFAFRRHWSFIAMLVTGLVLELVTFLTVNAIVARARPHVAHLGSVPHTSSFPSGHVAAAFVIYATLARYVTETVRRRWLSVAAWILAVLAPLAIAFSRVYRGMHYPTDTAFGLLMGVGVVAIVAAAFARGREVSARRDDGEVEQAGITERTAA